MYMQVKDLPDALKNALASVGYSRADIDIKVSETGSLLSSGGDGRRGFAILVNMSTNEYKTHWGSWGGSNMFSPDNQVDNNDQSYPIPENGAVINGSTGEKVYATITISPANAAKLLPTTGIVSDREADILKIFKSYTSKYRKEYLTRHNVTEDEIKSLASRGYLKVNKVGIQITTEGKNLASKNFL